MDLVRISRRLSYVLRHNPASVGLTLDANGWVAVADLLEAVGLTRAQLDEVVSRNDKQRFMIDGDRIRANQGHSVQVDLALEPAVPPATLFHGTPERNVGSILGTGLHKGERHHVHLSPDTATATRVGDRRGKAVVLAVDTEAMARDGHVFFRSANGVWLTESVPPAYLSVSGKDAPSSSP